MRMSLYYLNTNSPPEAMAVNIPRSCRSWSIISEGIPRLRARRRMLPDGWPCSKQTADAVSPPFSDVEHIRAKESRNLFLRCSSFQLLSCGCRSRLCTVGSPLTGSIRDNKVATVTKRRWASPVRSRDCAILVAIEDQHQPLDRT